MITKITEKLTDKRIKIQSLTIKEEILSEIKETRKVLKTKMLLDDKEITRYNNTINNLIQELKNQKLKMKSKYALNFDFPINKK